MSGAALHVWRAGEDYVADWGEGPHACAVGRGGIGEKHNEGDGITPAGLWPLRRVYYRPDRVAARDIAWPAQALAPHDGWCDAPGDSNYNRLVKLPYSASAENLWRDDRLYDVIVTIGYNDAPVMPGKGSALFVHVARDDYAPTEGCVALAREDLLRALARLSPQALLDVHP